MLTLFLTPELTLELTPEMVSRHFGPRTLRTQDISAPSAWCGSVRTGVSRTLGTGTELSRPPTNIFATIGRTEETFNTGITRYYY